MVFLLALRKISINPVLSAALIAAIAVMFPVGIGPQAIAAPPELGAGDDADPDADAAAAQPAEVEAAIRAFYANNVERAYTKLQEAEKKYPNLPPARVMLAKLYFGANQPAIGRAHLEQAVVDAPSDPEAHLALGDLASRERRLSDAELQFAEASRLLKEVANNKKFDTERKTNLFLQYYTGRAQLLASRQNWTEVEKTLRAMLKLKPDHITGLQRLAMALYAQGKEDEAEGELKKAVKASVDRVAELKKAGKTAAPLAPAPVLMANIVLNQSTKQTPEARVEEARKWLEKALNEAPNEPRAELAMANFLLGLGNVDEADEHARKAEKLDKNSVDIRLLCGQIARHKREFARAEKYFDSIHHDSPSYFPASNQLALVLVEQDDTEKQAKALDLAKINRSKEPRNIEAAATLGWVLYQQKRYEDAYEHLSAVMEAAQQRAAISPDSLYYMAKLASERGFKKESQQLLTQALESNGTFFHKEEASKWLKDQRK